MWHENWDWMSEISGFTKIHDLSWEGDGCELTVLLPDKNYVWVKQDSRISSTAWLFLMEEHSMHHYECIFLETKQNKTNLTDSY